ncbi:tyrosine-type recombinase/integrase [Kocuria sp. CPCC 205263]|uniref:tyrosine-type recombinase/integrase n=1 Tax=Kocuria sp. CPCC 205263 TaxID=3073555 RepID=UPI0034D3D288
MPRPPLPIGAYGRISLTPTPGGAYVAKARFRDYDGRTRLVERTAGSKAKAEKALKEAFIDRATPSNEDITGDTRIHALAAAWWVGFLEKDRAPATVRRYKEVLDSYVLPKLGGVRIREASVGLLDNALRSVRDKHGAPTAKLCQTVLRQMFALAARRNAVPMNPMRDVEPVHVEHKAVQALTVPQVQDLRSKLSGDVLDVLDVLLATGGRIGEVLAIRWEDVELNGTKSRVSITGTVVRSDKGLIRQDRPKSAGSMHRLFLPEFGADVFRRRAEVCEFVFPNNAGKLWEPTNFRKIWREATKDAGYGHVNPHLIRATVGTLLARAEGVPAASAQLGHSSETITVRHYVEKLADAPDASDALEVFGA